MKALLASVLVLRLVGSDVQLSLDAPQPFPGAVLAKVEVDARGCCCSAWQDARGWRHSFDFWGSRVWYVAQADSGAAPLSRAFLTFYDCKPRIDQVWLWWRTYGSPFGYTWFAQSTTVGQQFIGYAPAPTDRQPDQRTTP